MAASGRSEKIRSELLGFRPWRHGGHFMPRCARMEALYFWTHPPSLSDTALILSRHILKLERHRSRLFWSYPHTSGAAGSKNPTAPSTWQGRLLHVLLRFVYAEGPCRCCPPAVLTKQLLCSWHQRRLESCRCSQGMITWMVIPSGKLIVYALLGV